MPAFDVQVTGIAATNELLARVYGVFVEAFDAAARRATEESVAHWRSFMTRRTGRMVNLSRVVVAQTRPLTLHVEYQTAFYFRFQPYAKQANAELVKWVAARLPGMIVDEVRKRIR